MVTDEMRVDAVAGVTAISQDLLNTAFLTMRYGWTTGGSMLQANLRYEGWVPKIEIATTLGGGGQALYNPHRIDAKADLRSYFSIDAAVLLPVYFDWGSHTGLLQPSLELGYTNGLIFNHDRSITRGLHKMVAMLQFSDQARMAHRDFLPRWGYALRGNVAMEPFNDRFAPLWTGFARVMTPGLGRHHSLMLRGAYQGNGEGVYSFNQKELFPRGAEYRIAAQRYYSFSADYQLPLCYPDLGVPSLIYIKRVRLNLTGDMAKYRENSPARAWREIYSIGGQIIFDTNMLRAPEAATNTVGLSIFHPSDRKGLFVGMNVSVPL
jgi:hypothetical protein